MISRRRLLGAAAGAGALTLVPGAPALARDGSQNGWRIDPTAIATYRIEGSAASVALRRGAPAAVLLHVARRWHYEIAPLDTGEGGVVGYTTRRKTRAPYETNHFSGTAIALHPEAYPAGGSEPLWPHHELIVRDILVDCEGIVAWGGDLSPVKASHFHIAVKPGDKALARVGARLDTSRHVALRGQAAGAVADPGTPERRDKARRLPRPR